MSDTKRNALAELAENLANDNFFGVDHYKQELWLKQVRSIVAELAKVEWFYGVNDIPFPSMSDSMKCLHSCRAIAEEGAKDGNR